MWGVLGLFVLGGLWLTALELRYGRTVRELARLQAYGHYVEMLLKAEVFDKLARQAQEAGQHSDAYAYHRQAHATLDFAQRIAADFSFEDPKREIFPHV